MTEPEQHRRHVRRTLEASFRVRDAQDPKQGEILFNSVDVSQGGAFLDSELLLEVGQELEVTFGLPGIIRPIRARARVAWATRHDEDKGSSGMGLEFTEISEWDRQAIAEFIRVKR